MGHDHADHAEAETGGERARTKRSLALVLGLTTSFTIAEVIGGLLTGSLALLADAGHMLSDDLSLGLALFAMWLADRPAGPQRTFGYKRAEILAALFNGLTLVAISIWIFIEAYGRFDDPPEILGGWLLLVATVGMAINVAGFLILHRGRGESLNAAAALRHVLADLLGSAGVVAAAIVILLTGWRYIDPIMGVLIGMLVLASSWGVIRDSLRVLLEAAPKGLDPSRVGRRMTEVDGVREIHDLHIWTITSGFPALSAHVLVGAEDDCHARRSDLEQLLTNEFGIEHSTLQVEHAPEHPDYIELEDRRGRDDGRR